MYRKKLDKALIGAGVVYSGLTSISLITFCITGNYDIGAIGFLCLSLTMISMMIADLVTREIAYRVLEIVGVIIAIPAYIIYYSSALLLIIARYINGKIG